MNITVDDEIVRAAQTYARSRTAFKKDPRDPSQHDLAAHMFAALLVDRVIDTDAEAFVLEMREGARAMAEAESESSRPRRTSWR